MKAHGLNDLYAAAMEHSIKIAEVLAVHEKGETSDVSDIENILSGDEDKSPKALKGANMLRQDISKGGHSGAEKRHDTQFYHMRMED